MDAAAADLAGITTFDTFDPLSINDLAGMMTFEAEEFDAERDDMITFDCMGLGIVTVPLPADLFDRETICIPGIPAFDTIEGWLFW